MKIIRFLSVGMMAMVATACSVTGPARSPAPVVEKRPPAKAAEPSKPKAVAANGHYTVQKGDTLFRIAQEFQITWPDLVAWNNLVNPHDLKVGQVLRVTPPEAPASAGRAQAESVAPPAGVEVRPLPPGATDPALANKTGPRGDKQTYSEAAQAEMQRADSNQSSPNRNQNADEGRDADNAVTLIWPTEGQVISNFTVRRKGIEIAGEMGQPVLAAGAGTVQYASSIRGYGNVVILKHGNNLLSAYAHNKTILVKEGQTVRQGQKIAEMGNTDTDKVKLHFEIRQQGKPVDPTKFLPSR